ncbi:MAG: tRNA pseudouridine(55) synthase TruB [Planctomycetes bacterium]|nr:tRNA pseudouridine(55) synthase TruB [Planctomycetota bacterium]
MTDGILVINKPVGATSHQVVAAVRRVSGEGRIGHTGTLDPMASGVLVLCAGRATRLAEFLSGCDKCYCGTVRLGSATDTYDATGKVLAQAPVLAGQEQVEEALQPFRGRIRQRPPAFSALRSAGRRAYKLARAGEPVELAEREVHVYELRLLEYCPPDATLLVRCSAGTYVRSLAHDLGERLGCHGHLAALRRTACGVFTIDDARPLDLVEGGRLQEFLLPMEAGLRDWPALALDAEEARLLANGRTLPLRGAAREQAVAGRLLRAHGPDGALLAIVEPDPEAGVLRPRKVFPP